LGQSRDRCTRQGPHAARERAVLGGFNPICFNGIVICLFNRNVKQTLLCEKLTIFPCAEYIVGISGSLASEDTVKFQVDLEFERNMQKCNSIADVLVSSQQIVAAS